MYTQRNVIKVIISVIRVKLTVYLFTFNMLTKVTFVGNTFFLAKLENSSWIGCPSQGVANIF